MHSVPLGVEWRQGQPQAGGLVGHVLRLRAGIERDTGEMPPVCPWRAYTDPVVVAALTLRKHWTNGAIDIDQQLAVVVDAMLLIDSTQSHVEALDARAERERRAAAQKTSPTKG